MSNSQEKQGRATTIPDADNNLGRGAPADRDERIRQRAHNIWEQEGRPDGRAKDHWDRAAQDLDREEAAIQGEGVAGETPGVRSGPERGRKQGSSEKL
ncbi:MAG TPA: DUF2934 domain-containing protein [Dongiaceae bacterium]|nr:DUF2934 domain-containing protein [Dongiaceae bacterium]